jgi:DNA-binding MarR family transcriptional regulator
MTKKRINSRSLALSLSVSRLNAELARRLDRKLGALHGISFVDFTVLNELSRDGGGRMRRVDLADTLGLTQSAVTRILAPLERIGLVSRHPDPNDARVGYAALSKAGRTILEEATVTAQVACDDIFNGITDSDLDAVNTVMRRLVR